MHSSEGVHRSIGGVYKTRNFYKTRSLKEALAKCATSRKVRVRMMALMIAMFWSQRQMALDSSDRAERCLCEVLRDASRCCLCCSLRCCLWDVACEVLGDTQRFSKMLGDSLRYCPRCCSRSYPRSYPRCSSRCSMLEDAHRFLLKTSY